MNKEQQKFYLRGYAKGRAFQKKNQDPLLSVTYDLPKDFGTIRDHEEVSLFNKALTLFRNGLSL